jgi:hypothetical protein
MGHGPRRLKTLLSNVAVRIKHQPFQSVTA